MTEKTYSAVREIKAKLGFTDDELADILGSSRSHVQSLVSGRYKEHLTAKQRAALLRAAHAFRDLVTHTVDKVELLI